MIQELKNIKSSKSDLRKFGLIVGIVLILIGSYLFWKDSPSYKYFAVVGLLLAVCGLAVPVLLRPLNYVWMTIAVVLGWIMTRVILSIFFYLVITPISLGSRLFGKQFMELKWNQASATYWNKRSPDEFDQKAHEKQF
jgi:hypothetical protein